MIFSVSFERHVDQLQPNCVVLLNAEHVSPVSEGNPESHHLEMIQLQEYLKSSSPMSVKFLYSPNSFS